MEGPPRTKKRSSLRTQLHHFWESTRRTPSQHHRDTNTCAYCSSQCPSDGPSWASTAEGRIKKTQYRHSGVFSALKKAGVVSFVGKADDELNPSRKDKQVFSHLRFLDFTQPHEIEYVHISRNKIIERDKGELTGWRRERSPTQRA